MKRITLLLIGACLAFNINAQKPIAKHVVLIGLDGFGAYALPEAEMPVLKKLMKEGAWSLKVRTVLPSSSAVNWASIIMGAGPTMHGYTEWNSVNPEIPSASVNSGGMFPSIFSLLKEQKPGAKSAVIFSWGGIDPLVQKETADIRINARDNDSFCVDTATAIIKNQKPVFTFIHLDQPDGVGHNIGHRTKEYYKELINVDARIGKIVKAVNEAGIANETIIIITSDHGGINKGHGGKSVDEVNVPWIAFGKGIAKNHELKSTMVTFDTAATIAWILGLKTPDSWRGIAIKEILYRK
ncbi:MAG: alkaline phosphatase [Niabella sp.]|nr:MAG: alkaline phosphatase [Niabella sp.]